MWITKYALSGGLIKMSAPQDAGDGYVRDAFKKNDYRLYVRDRDVFADESAAKADADRRRHRKIASLKKQIAKLEAMQF
jgi:hypothetical protein